MKNNVHYGEFTLYYWLDQLLSGNLDLPEYQRHLAWNKDQIVRLLKGFGKDNFVPPVTIGRINDTNQVIDGQQRLTAIILAFLNKYPKDEVIKDVVVKPAEAEDDEAIEKTYLKWTYRDLPGYGDGIEAVKAKIKDHPDYEDFDMQWVHEEFLNQHYLGFCYIVPGKGVKKDDILAFFSNVFYSVNSQGTPLKPEQSRKALYYWKAGYVPLFDPKFAQSIKIKQFGHDTTLDFLRQLALVFAYAKDEKKFQEKLKIFKKDPETYYELFIKDITDNSVEEKSGLFKSLTEVMAVNNIKNRMQKLKEAYDKLDYPNEFNSIIEIDTIMFGLIYWVLIKDYRLKEDEENIIKLKEAIQSKITGFTKEKKGAHKRSPNSAANVLSRIKKSIRIYKKFTER
ncbi:MAG: DUF262 domain-containing protein [Muribaculaceae bacterium]|nr:DUF262 domain-containing protein [Muribaculaceae bacterium]